MVVAPYFWSIDVIRRIVMIQDRLIVMRGGDDAKVIIRGIVVGRRGMGMVGLITDGDVVVVMNGGVRGRMRMGGIKRRTKFPFEERTAVLVEVRCIFKSG